MRNKKRRDLYNLLLQHSFVDLAESFFILNLWLPNIASPIKGQFLYTILETVCKKLPTETQIRSYKDFATFTNRLLKLLPSYPQLEDYIPEQDWADVKYFYDEKFFKVFYGGDLSTSYDFRYAFEVVHSGFEDVYRERLERSALEEFAFELQIENAILEGISHNSEENHNVVRGHFELPPEFFWEECKAFLSTFNPLQFGAKRICDSFSANFFDSDKAQLPSEDKFISQTFNGKNCFYLFTIQGERYFPVLPRKNFSVLFDTWGELLASLYPDIKTEINGQAKITANLASFVEERVRKERYFSLVCPIDERMEAVQTVFASSLLTDDRMMMLHVLPPYCNDNSQQDALDEMPHQFRNAEKLLSSAPTRLGLLAENKMTELTARNGRSSSLEPELLAIFPTSLSYSTGLRLPIDFRWKICGLEQILGLLDEIENPEELEEFLIYVKDLEQSTEIMPLTTLLDLFGSFRDSSSVLVAGATDYTSLMIDPHWGSNHRYKTLSEFWKVYPQIETLGHPRGWKYIGTKSTENTKLFKSRTTFAYFRTIQFGACNLIISSPVNLFSNEHGEISEFVMDGLADSFEVYRDLLLPIFSSDEPVAVHILVFPLNAVEKRTRFGHLLHLFHPEERWSMDFTRVRDGNNGVRIVFNDELVSQGSLNAENREMQVSLLIDVIRSISENKGGEEFESLIETLTREKSKQNRFKRVVTKDRVSFPRNSSYILPKIKDRKLAHKLVATLAKNNGIKIGSYADKNAEGILNTIIGSLLDSIDATVEAFDLATTLPMLIANIDALVSEKDFEQARIKSSLDQEVDYERTESASNKQLDFSFYHGVYRYAIEKVVQLQPRGGSKPSEKSISGLLALIEQLLHLYFVSDQLYYGLYPSTLSVADDYLVTVETEVDFDGMMRELTSTEAKIELGMIGIKEDRINQSVNPNEYLESIGDAFLEDFGFSFSDLLAVLHLLSNWGFKSAVSDIRTNYSATAGEIEEMCASNIDDFARERSQRIIDFLMLDPIKLLTLAGSTQRQSTLPVWEYRKRIARYNLQPLLKIEDKYNWGPFSTERTSQLWADIFRRHKLPCDLDAPNLISVLNRGHDEFTGHLQQRIVEILLRYTPYVEPEVFPHSIHLSDKDIGDIDVLALSTDKKILFNIESKVIDEFYCNKDMKRASEKIFGRVTSDGSFRPGYLHAVEGRRDFLLEKGKELANHYWSDLPNDLKVISLFVTAKPLWWTMFPLVETDVVFLEIRLLDDFIKKELA